MLRDIIIANEGIDIICDDPNGFEYLGIDCDVPWAFNMNTKLLSKKRLHSNHEQISDTNNM